MMWRECRAVRALRRLGNHESIASRAHCPPRSSHAVSSATTTVSSTRTARLARSSSSPPHARPRTPPIAHPSRRTLLPLGRAPVAAHTVCATRPEGGARFVRICVARALACAASPRAALLATASACRHPHRARDPPDHASLGGHARSSRALPSARACCACVTCGALVRKRPSRHTREYARPLRAHPVDTAVRAQSRGPIRRWRSAVRTLRAAGGTACEPRACRARAE